MSGQLQQLKNLSKYLEETESELSAFWLLVPALLIVANNGKFIKVSPFSKQLLGYNYKELENIDYKSLIHPDDLNKTTEEESKLNKGFMVQSFINRLRHKNGQWIEILWHAYTNKESGNIYAVGTRPSKTECMECLLK